MTKQNPFEKLWKRFEEYAVKLDCLIAQDLLIWRDDFIDECRKQAKKAEKNKWKQIKETELNKGQIYREARIWEWGIYRGEEDAFHLVMGNPHNKYITMQGTAQNNNKTKGIMVLRGKKNRAKQNTVSSEIEKDIKKILQKERDKK